MSTTRLVDLTPDRRPAVIELYERYFGAYARDRLLERWRWQFENNPFTAERQSAHVIAVADDMVVGYFAAFPTPVRCGGRRAIYLVPCDLVVDADHRSAFLSLMRAHLRLRPVLGTGFNAPLERFFSSRGFTLVPQSRCRFVLPLRRTGAICRALRRQRRPLRWLGRPAVAAALSLLLGVGKGRASGRLAPSGSLPDIQEMRGFDDSHDALWVRVAAEADFAVDRDARYMNWRYASWPGTSIRCFGLRDGGDERAPLRGVVVVGVATALDLDRRPCGRDGVILELIAPAADQAAVRDLVSFAVRALDRNRVDTVHTLHLHAAHHETLAGLGFAMTDGGPHRLAFLPPEGAEADAAVPGSCYVSAGDGDQSYWNIL